MSVWNGIARNDRITLQDLYIIATLWGHIWMINRFSHPEEDMRRHKILIYFASAIQFYFQFVPDCKWDWCKRSAHIWIYRFWSTFQFVWYALKQFAELSVEFSLQIIRINCNSTTWTANQMCLYRLLLWGWYHLFHFVIWLRINVVQFMCDIQSQVFMHPFNILQIA